MSKSKAKARYSWEQSKADHNRFLITDNSTITSFGPGVIATTHRQVLAEDICARLNLSQQVQTLRREGSEDHDT